MKVTLAVYEGVPVSIELPQKAMLEVMETEPTIKSQTAVVLLQTGGAVERGAHHGAAVRRPRHQDRGDDRRRQLRRAISRIDSAMIEPKGRKQGVSRRQSMQFIAAAVAALTAPAAASAQGSRASFDRWIETFRARAQKRGISDATYTRVMDGLKPDNTVFGAIRDQPEFNEQLWQYLNRRVSDWRITTGKEKAQEVRARCLAASRRIIGVDARGHARTLGHRVRPSAIPLVQQNHMRPVIPALAALAWGEPRRRTYWETELINALVIIENGWGTPAEMNGSWAGAMGHTQWMPEVWLNVGFDYDHDGRVNPFGKPDDALGSTRALSGPARQIPARRALGLRGARARQASAARHRAAMRRGRSSGVVARRRPGLPAAERHRQTLGAGRGRAGVSARAEFLCGAAPIIRR